MKQQRTKPVSAPTSTGPAPHRKPVRELDASELANVVGGNKVWQDDWLGPV